MSVTQTFKLVAPNTGRTISDDDWREIEPLHIRTWTSATEVLKERILVSQGRSYRIHIDWMPSVRQMKQTYAGLEKIDSNRTSGVGDIFRGVQFPSRSAKHTIIVETDGTEKGFSSIAETVVYDAFLMLNLASPGCCDFHRATLIEDSSVNRENDISLSGTLFESVIYQDNKLKIPISNKLDLVKVRQWFESVRSGADQIPQNPSERVIFALFHMAALDLSPTAVIWIFYALESLFQTRIGENFTVLVKRISLFLDMNKQETDKLKKEMRKLYEIRSAIVHGGYELAHPMHNELLDSRLDRTFERLLSSADWGYKIIVASIQRLIELEWRFPVFDENLRGEPMYSSQPSNLRRQLQ